MHAIFRDFDMDGVLETIFEEILTSVPSDEATIDQLKVKNDHRSTLK